MRNFLPIVILFLINVAFASELSQAMYRCTSRDRLVRVCRERFSLVCGWFTTPAICAGRRNCNINAGNRCEACRDRRVLYVVRGGCPGL